MGGTFRYAQEGRRTEQKDYVGIIDECRLVVFSAWILAICICISRN